MQKYHIMGTYSLRSKSVTSEYAGFRTFIAMLRILRPFSYEARPQFVHVAALLRRELRQLKPEN